MTSLKKLLSLQQIFSKLEIDQDEIHAVLPLTTQIEVDINAEEPAENWPFLNNKTHTQFNSKTMTDTMLATQEEIVKAWNKICGGDKEELSAESAENLEASGFEGLPGSEESVPIVNDQPEEKASISREEAERKLEMAELAKQEEEENQPNKHNKAPRPPAEPQAIFTDRPVEYVDAPAPKIGEVNVFDILNKICKNDLMQIFGPTGTCKTSLCTRLALDARAKNKSVLYIDTEGSINDDQIIAMKKTGTKYEFIKRFAKLCEFVKKLPKVDVLIVDSAGVPALAAYCKANLGGQGQILKDFIALSDDLKTYATDNGSLVVVINQPESSMGKGEDVILEPFGEKSRYYYKEILKTNYAKRGRKTEKTTLVLRAHRSRCMGIDKPVCTIEVTDEGIKAVV